MDNENERRILIHISVTAIPGAPAKRPWTLWELFCQQQLQRKPIYKESVPTDGFDSIHIPPNFDSANNIRVWFLIDVGVKEYIPPAEVVNLPHEVYRISLDTSSNQCYTPGDIASESCANDL